VFSCNKTYFSHALSSLEKYEKRPLMVFLCSKYMFFWKKEIKIQKMAQISVYFSFCICCKKRWEKKVRGYLVFRLNFCLGGREKNKKSWLDRYQADHKLKKSLFQNHYFFFVSHTHTKKFFFSFESKWGVECGNKKSQFIARALFRGMVWPWAIRTALVPGPCMS